MSLSEAERAEIVRRWYGGGSYRTIARAVGVNRKTVAAVIDAHQKQRSQLNLALQAPAKRKSLLDPYEAQIETLLNRYPDLTAVRLHEELQAAGFTGGYTIVKARLRKVRPRPLVEPVVRFETGPGIQAQMDYSPFEIDFLSEGKRRVYAFSYILGYSRRRYLRFVESQDHTTTVREHVRAFEHLGGVATVCLYDSMKVVVHYWDGEQPIYNGRFLAFALHYGFRPWACRRRRPQTKGKVENPFLYIVRNLLNGRSFSSLEHLNTFVAEQWLPMVDRRKHDTTKRPPLEIVGRRTRAPRSTPRASLRHRRGALPSGRPRMAHSLQAELLLRPLRAHRTKPSGTCERQRGHHLLARGSRNRSTRASASSFQPQAHESQAPAGP